jgi:putative ABC transport system substrate-binding protein
MSYGADAEAQFRRVATYIVLCLCLLASPLVAEAQPAGKAWRIGYLTVGSPPPPSAAPSPVTAAFRQGLRELGYVEGQNITIEHRWAAGQSHRLPELAAELVKLKVSVIVASATQAALAAKQAARTIPIVFVTLGDPVDVDLVSSLARPGGNATGLGSGGGGEIGAKRLQLLKEIVPGVTRVAVLWNPRNPGNVGVMKALTEAARLLGAQLHPHEVPEPAALGQALTAIPKEPVGALVVAADPTFTQGYGVIVDFAAKNRLPAIYPDRRAAEAGGLISYQTNLADLHRRAAGYVDKILKGAKPEALPVEMATRFELVINLKTAKALGLTIPPSLLARADHVIE